MPIKLQKLPGEPIAIGTYDGIVRCREVEAATAQALSLFESEGISVDQWRYYVVDVRTLEMDFAEMTCIIDYELKGLPGTFSDPCTYAVMVGTNMIVRAFQKIMHQQGIDAGALAIYLSMEEAFLAIRAHIAQHNS